MNHGLQRPLTMALRRQSGISLVIVMVLLIATSILGIAVLRSSAMQERMSANLRDRSLAFQAAEAALRYAQNVVLAGATWDTQPPADSSGCTADSVCSTGTGTDGEPAIVWSEVPDAAFDFGDAGLGAAPEYWIEYLGDGPGRRGSCDTLPPSLDCRSPMYRVTARSRAEGRADVMLQANIISRIPEPGT